MLPVIPGPSNDWLKSTNPTMALGAFPPNLVSNLLPPDRQQEIYRFMLDNYIWPQVMERFAFEGLWRKILDMYRIKLDKVDLSIEEATRAGESLKTDTSNSGNKARLADSVVYDAVERLTDVQHFISWKNQSPIQYNIPPYYNTSAENAFYHPFKDKIQAANCLLQWNIDNEEVYFKHILVSRQFYQFGAAFVKSEFLFQLANVLRMDNQGQQRQIQEINKIGTSFEPLSIWKIWLNYRLSANEMEYQPCPFFFEETPRFATLQNQYHPINNPFGFGNLDKVATAEPTWLYSTAELQGLVQAMQDIPSLDNQKVTNVPQIINPEHSVEALWTFYPMLPLDPVTLDWKTYPGGAPVPLTRFLMQSWGTNLSGKQIVTRLQRNFYPRDMLPLYGAAHMPDLESGLYPPSLGYLLWNHYREIVTCKNQYIVNKELINDPPAWVQAGSPAVGQKLFAVGAKVEVNSKADFGFAEVHDATTSTVNFMTMTREQAKTASKSDDAILGKALGGRTSATEAQNIFQASMSALTTPINMFNYHIMGGYATRVWEYSATWFPPELLKSITGQMGFILSPEDLWTRVGLKWDVGSTYIESILRQQNIQYILQSSMGDMSINRAPLWRELLTEWRFTDISGIVNDGGFAAEVYKATDQATRTYLGEQIVINPDQNHQIAIQVKTAFLEDMQSPWNTKYPQGRIPLVVQIQEHQKILLLQMQLMAAQREAAQPLGGGNGGSPPAPGGGGQSPLQNGNPALTGGDVAQQAAGMMG